MKTEEQLWEVVRRKRKRRTGIDKSIKMEKWIILEGYKGGWMKG